MELVSLICNKLATFFNMT